MGFEIKKNVLIRYTEESSVKEIVVPVGVREIADKAFHDCVNLEEITLPDSVMLIKSCAFYACTGLKRINIPPQVTSIHMGTFQYCTRLTEVRLPEGLRSIDAEAFRFCKSLEEIKIPQSVESIGERAFYKCLSLKSISIPDGVTSIENAAFQECTNLTEVHLPESIKRIGEYAFFRCENLKSISISGTVEAKAFWGCHHLSNIQFRWRTDTRTAYEIQNGAFRNCHALEEIIIPAGVTVIHHAAFAGCRNLKKVTLPEGLFFIKSDAFSMCALETVHIPDSVQNIGLNAFNECSRLKELHYRGFVFPPDDDNSADLPEIRNAIKKKTFQYLWPLEVRYCILFQMLQRNDIQENAYLHDNIHELIQYAIEHHQHEFYLLLMEYKNQYIGYEDTDAHIRKKFEL